MTRAEYFHILELKIYTKHTVKTLFIDTVKTRFLIESVKICGFNTFRVGCFA